MLAIEVIKEMTPHDLPAITLITGEDEGQYTIIKEKLLEQLGYDPSDLATSYFDLSQTSYEEAALDLESLPFFSDDKLVIFDQFLDVTTTKKNYLEKNELEAFEAYVQNPVETTRLIIFAPGKLDGKRRVVKRLKEKSQLLEITKVKEADLRDYMKSQLAKWGLEMTPELLEQFLEKSQFDFALSYRNAQLLQEVKGQGTVALANLQEILPRSLQDDVFLLSQQLMKKDIASARQLAKDLMLQGQDAIALLAVLMSQFRTYLQVKELSALRKTQNQIVSELSDILSRRVNPYQVTYALREAQKLTRQQLYQMVKILIEADYAMKSGRSDKDYLLDMAFLKIVAL